MFHYEFMILAFVAAGVLAIAFPLVGSPAVHKRLSASGDALAHSSLAGVAIGLAAGANPLYISIIACVVSFLIIGFLRRKFGKYAEIGVTVVLSAAIAIAGILSGYTQGASLESYLFGSILLITYTELGIVCGIAGISVLFFALTYYRLLHSLYSEEEASIAKIRVYWLDIIHSLLFSLVVAVGAKIVGSLVVSSMLVLPTAAALLWRKGYRDTTFISLVYSLASMLGGITISYYTDWKPGATCVGLMVALLLVTLLIRGIIVMASRQVRKKSLT